MAIVATSGHPVRPSPPLETATWQQALKTAIRDPVQLCQALSLPPEYEPAAIQAARPFPVFAPLGFVAKMKPQDPRDPLLRQVLPLAEELDDVPGFDRDPVGDAAASLRPGLIQKYQGRALLITTGACAVHCRYCFRRHFPYQQAPRSLADWRPIVDEIATDMSIEEVLFSGGDPLTLADAQLAELAAELATIRHVRRLRVHTRLPIMIPERVTGALIAWLTGSRLTSLVVVHANHPNELDGAVADAMGRLVDAGIPVLNQAVLLRGVNDHVSVLAELCARLIDLRVMPYYLHQLDRVAGAAHFEVPIDRGRQLIQQLRARLPGYAVPRYAQEIAGASSKIILA